VYEVVVMMLFAAVAIVVLGLLLTPLLIKVLAVRRERLMPVVFVLCVIGSYAIQQRMFDVWVMVIFGVLGFALRQMRYPMAPLVLGIVLGDIFDKSFRRSWVINGGDFSFYFTRPISLVLMGLCAITLLMSFAPSRRYFAPKAGRLSRALFGGAWSVLRVHGTLLGWLLRGSWALTGTATADLPAGVDGFVAACRRGFSTYASTWIAAVRELLQATFDFFCGPLLDLLRLARVLPKP